MACTSCGNKIKPEVKIKATVQKISEIVPASKVRVVVKQINNVN